MGFIRVTTNGHGFEDAVTGMPFVPVGSNYCAVVAGQAAGGYCGQVFPLFGCDEYTEADGLAEGRRAFARMAELQLNVVRIWLEPDVFFSHGRRLDPAGAAQFDALLAAGREFGLRISVGLHLCPISSGGKLYSHEPPHDERLREMLYLLARRWGHDEQIFSFTIIGEGTLPWQTPWLAQRWPAFLQYWYNDDLVMLQREWGDVGVDFSSFQDAPIPPRNVGYAAGLGAVNPGNIARLPVDPWAGSTWRYDWRLFLEEIGSSRVHREAKALRDGGARQMITVGNNSWIFPNLACGQMGLGYNPYFYLDSVDYLCQHQYPAPQCLPGGNGDPLDSEDAMQSWEDAVSVMGRSYRSLGKPVVLEEWGWHGGGPSSFLCPLPFRTLEEQDTYGNRLMEVTRHVYSGWLYWMWRDMPAAIDITNRSGLYQADGNTLKPWGRSYGQWAERLRREPPTAPPATRIVEMPMQELYTDDRAHENWLQAQMLMWRAAGPCDFRPVFPRKPMTDVETNLTGASPTKARFREIDHRQLGIGRHGDFGVFG